MPGPNEPTPVTPIKPANEWPSLVESGAGLSEDPHIAGDPLETAATPRKRFDLVAHVRKRPMLYIGIGALAVGGVAAILGRKAILRAATPMVLNAARRRPWTAAKLAARNPGATAKLVALSLQPALEGGLRKARELPDMAREATETVRERLPQLLRRRAA